MGQQGVRSCCPWDKEVQEMNPMFATTCCLGARSRWWHKEMEHKQSTDAWTSGGDWVLQLLKLLKCTGLIWRGRSWSFPRLRARLQEAYAGAAAVGLSAETLLNIVSIQFRWQRGQALGIKYSGLEQSSKPIHTHPDKEWKQAWQAQTDPTAAELVAGKTWNNIDGLRHSPNFKQCTIHKVLQNA